MDNTANVTDVDDVTRTIIAKPPKLGRSGELKNACLIHIYPTGPDMGKRHVLNFSTLTIGRGDDCTVRIQDSSVSRKHVIIEPGDQGFIVRDNKSTNGTFVNDKQIITSKQLTDGDYIRVGNCLFRYLAGGNVEAHYHEEIYRLTIIDALTETYNVRYFNEFLDREILRSQRHQRPLSLLMFDVDKFKNFNDNYGHLCGDFVLREISKRVKDTVRKEDLFARYGGEEFACVLVETQKQNAKEVAERIRRVVCDQPFVFEQQSLTMTISVGVAFTTGSPAMTSTELIEAADQKLYEAKNSGRNKVC